MVYWAHLIGSFLLRFIPPQVGYFLADLFAPLIGFCWPGHYRRARHNMAHVLGPSADPREISRRVRGVFRNYGKYMIDLLWLPQAHFQDLDRNFRIVGLDHIDQAMRRGNGLVLVTAHMGNWDLAGAVLAGKGYPVNVIVETLEPLRWNERVQDIRERVGMKAIPLENGVRDMLAVLRSNEILGVLIDRPLDRDGIPVRFFDAVTRVPEGAAKLALRTGAGVVAAGIVRQGRRFVAHVSPLLDVEPSGDRTRDAQELTQQAMNWLESVIHQYPEQWFMFRNMWPREA
ncbi:MAG TPA: lysophospholipid acyltransferase family protein [Chloroflexota bacterium]|nr:lysophospholipid acyltransferase family protein [Chloroflexota bacterium]